MADYRQLNNILFDLKNILNWIKIIELKNHLKIQYNIRFKKYLKIHLFYLKEADYLSLRFVLSSYYYLHHIGSEHLRLQ